SGSSPAYTAAGQGSGPPPVWIGPGSAPSPNSPLPPTAWAAPGSGPSGWATPGSGFPAAPSLPPSYATGLPVVSNQAPITPPPPHRRRLAPLFMLVLALVVIAAGGTTWVLAGGLQLSKGGTTPTATPLPSTLSGIITEFAVPTPN